MDISIVIPVYNEKEYLPEVYQQLLSVFSDINKEYEIIFVDDGSFDGSSDILKGLSKQDRRVKVISLDRNYGQTSAFDAGFKLAQGGIVLLTDADLPFKMSVLLQIIDKLKTYDVAACYRTNRRECDGFIKHVSSLVANKARNIVLGEYFRDAGCSLKGFHKESLDKIKLYRGFNVFILSLLKAQGAKISDDLEVKSYPRKYGKSNYNIRNRLFKELRALFVVKYINGCKLNYSIREIF